MSASLTETVERIASAPAPSDVTPGDLTGELARLAAWWDGLTGGASLRAAELVCDGDAADALACLERGVEAAERAVDSGATVIVPRVARREDPTARTVIALLTRRESSAVLHQPAGMTDAAWMQAAADIRDRAADVMDCRGEPITLVQSLEAFAMAEAAGVLIGAAARRTPCLIDGTDELAAALIADRLCIRAHGWWRAGSTSPDPGRAAATERIDLTAGLPWGLWDDAGQGAQATLAILALVTTPREPSRGR